MWQKTYFLGALVFFLVMNVLLWRSQYGQKDLALPIPVETVTRRMFSATDDSTLDISRHGVKIGYCRWSPQTLSQVPAASSPGSTLPEGMIGNITGYSVGFDGALKLDSVDHIRFFFSLELDTNFVWGTVRAWLAMPDYRIEARSKSEEETVHVAFTQGESVREQVFSFAQLQDPRTLLGGLGGGIAVQALAAAGFAFPQTQSGDFPLGLKWEAHTDRHRMGNSTFPVYRLETEILGDYRVRATILPSGELLRIELPDNIMLLNFELNRM